MKTIQLLGLIAVSTVLTVRGATPTWPAFRGPNASGVLDKATPPVKIGPSNSVLWKITVPFSPSSPCVSDEQLFLTTYADNELQTRSYQRQDGKLLWSRGVKPDKLEMFHSTENSPAGATPVTDGERVVSYFGSFGLVCYDRAGKELWRHPLSIALSGGGYGTGSSPIISGNLVIISRDRDRGSSLLAVDIHTGQKVWETPRPDVPFSYGSPIVWENNGVAEVVMPGSNRLKGYELKTGKDAWYVDGVAAFVCTTPVIGDGMLLFAAWSDGKADSPWGTWEQFLEKNDKNKDGVITLDEFDDASRDYWRGLDVNRDGKIDKHDWDVLQAEIARSENVMVALKPGGHGDISKTHVAWKFTRGLPYVASPLVYDGRVYLMKNGGMLSSLDVKTGQPYYTQERLGAEGYYYSSPVGASGRIYVASVQGKLTVIKAGGDKPEILHQVDFGERIHATPALAENNLYLRTASSLYAFGPEKAP